VDAAGATVNGTRVFVANRGDRGAVARGPRNIQIPLSNLLDVRMPLLRRICLLPVLAALLSTTACDDPLRPEDVAGTYVLRTVRGDALPAFFWEGDQTQLRVLADTLRLHADGTGNEVWLLEYTGQHASESGRTESALQFGVVDGRLEGGYSCSAFCLTVFQPIEGEFTRNGLRIDVAKYAAGPLEFVRVDQ
jgi:hypothetical protein